MCRIFFVFAEEGELSFEICSTYMFIILSASVGSYYLLWCEDFGQLDE